MIREYQEEIMRLKAGNARPVGSPECSLGSLCSGTRVLPTMEDHEDPFGGPDIALCSHLSSRDPTM